MSNDRPHAAFRKAPEFYAGDAAFRKAPEFYAGETYRGMLIQHPDVERWPNGALPSRRNKHMRRLIRGALKRKFSSITQSLMRAQALSAETRAATENGHEARRLLAKEIAARAAARVEAVRDLRSETLEERHARLKVER